MSDTYADLKAAIAARARCNREGITPETQLCMLGLDSLGVVELISDIESLFGIRLPAAECLKLERVSDVAEIVNSCTRKCRPPS